MTNLNLEAKNSAEQRIKDYLEQNASEVLTDKINNGVLIEKDGKTLRNKKTLGGFMSYATEEARKMVESGARSACIESSVVFGWAIHYFEEDSIEGTLYNEDGTEYAKPKPAPKKPKKEKKAVKEEVVIEKITPPSEEESSIHIPSEEEPPIPLPKKKKAIPQTTAPQISLFDF